MHVANFAFSSLHLHNNAFFDFLALRKKVFVDEMGWDVPHDDTHEMDQYDTPMAHYSVALMDGKVVGGARTMATTSVWGEHTYMLRDAWSGKLPHIPRHVMSVEIASPLVWECTRLVISDRLTSQEERSECLTLIVDGLIDMARAKGAASMISLSPLPFMRAMRQQGYDVSRLGDIYRNDEDGRQYAVLQMPCEYSRARRERSRPIPFVAKSAAVRLAMVEDFAPDHRPAYVAQEAFA